MKALKNIIAAIKLIAKYSGIVMAVIKGIQVIQEELEALEAKESLEIESSKEPKE